MRTVLTLACAIAIMATTFAAPIIMRHDVAAARFRELGEQHRPVLVALGLRSEEDGAPMLYSGMGTLIAPDWVVTAAHAAVMIAPKSEPPPKEHFVFNKGRGYRVARVVFHPDWTDGKDENDIALIQLDRAVLNPAPACLYTGSDEAGKVVTVVGQGIPGTGLTGPAERDGVLRGATVRVDVAETTTLRWKFKHPDDPLVTPLEGISGPGDSGGPALLPAGGKLCIAGVSSVQRIEVTPGTPREKVTQGRYGVIEVYTRISAYVPWIQKTAGLR